MVSWNAQIGGGKYAIQFETDNRDLFRLVEQACQIAIDRNELARLREEKSCETCAHYDEQYGYDMPQCKECGPRTGFKYHTRKLCPSTRVECSECIPGGPCAVGAKEELL